MRPRDWPAAVWRAVARRRPLGAGARGGRAGARPATGVPARAAAGSVRRRYGACGDPRERRAAPGQRHGASGLRQGRTAAAGDPRPAPPPASVSCELRTGFHPRWFRGTPRRRTYLSGVWKRSGTSLDRLSVTFPPELTHGPRPSGATVPAWGPAQAVPCVSGVHGGVGCCAPREPGRRVPIRSAKVGLKLPEVLRERFRSVWSMNGLGKMDFGRGLGCGIGGDHSAVRVVLVIT